MEEMIKKKMTNVDKQIEKDLKPNDGAIRISDTSQWMYAKLPTKKKPTRAHRLAKEAVESISLEKTHGQLLNMTKEEFFNDPLPSVVPVFRKAWDESIARWDGLKNAVNHKGKPIKYKPGECMDVMLKFEDGSLLLFHGEQVLEIHLYAFDSEDDEYAKGMLGKGFAANYNKKNELEAK